jgi:putative transposase
MEQCNLLGISRTAYYYKRKRNINTKEIELSKEIINTLEKKPFYGYRKIAIALKNSGATPKKVRRIMKKLGLRAIYPKKNLSKPEKSHKIYPYLLKNKEIFLPNQAWASDITYIKLKGGHVYLVAIIDVFSRKILSWRLSNSLDTEFVVAALEEAIQIFGVPAIFNTDQGSQFTSEKFTSILKNNRVQISMDSVGRALDNIYMERWWRSLKYEDIFLNSYDYMGDLKLGVKRYIKFYNTERFHQSLGYATPDEIYYGVFGGNKDIMAA